MTEFVALRLFAFIAVGALLGFAFLAALRLNVRLYLDSGAAWITILAHALRVLAIVIALTLCAHHGALALIFCVVGFHLMRTVAIDWLTLAPASKP